MALPNLDRSNDPDNEDEFYDGELALDVPAFAYGHEPSELPVELGSEEDEDKLPVNEQTEEISTNPHPLLRVKRTTEEYRSINHSLFIQLEQKRKEFIAALLDIPSVTAEIQAAYSHRNGKYIEIYKQPSPDEKENSETEELSDQDTTVDTKANGALSGESHATIQLIDDLLEKITHHQGSAEELTHLKDELLQHMLSVRIKDKVLESFLAASSDSQHTPIHHQARTAQRKLAATKKEIVTTNYNLLRGLAIKSYRTYMRRTRGGWMVGERPTIEILDLEQEGSFGLMIAIEKFNRHLGFHFSTYATHWIEQQIQRGLSSISNMMRIPLHMNERVTKYNNAYNRLAGINGQKPTDEQIQGITGLTSQQIAAIKQVAKEPLSIDAPAFRSEDGSISIVDSTPDNAALSPIDYIDIAWERKAIEKLIDSLYDERTKLILRMRYGLNGYDEHTLEATATALGKIYPNRVTRERVRQIEAVGFRIIKDMIRTTMPDTWDEYTHSPSKPQPKPRGNRSLISNTK